MWYLQFRSITRYPHLVAALLCTNHQSLLWFQKFFNNDGVLARWYTILGQFSVTFEYRPGSQHANVDGLSRQCGQCIHPDCPVEPPDLAVVETSSTTAMTDQPLAESAMGDSTDTDLLPEMSGETWVASVHLDEATGDLTPPDSDPDLIASSLADATGVDGGFSRWTEACPLPTKMTVAIADAFFQLIMCRF